MDEDRIFQALAHRTRRIILRTLAEEGPQTYTSLLKRTGLTTGTLNHHLEKMKGLIVSNRGMYELTDEGWRAYRAMVAVEGGSGGVRVSSPVDLIIRPSWGFENLARMGPSFVATSLLIGLLAIVVTLRFFGASTVLGNALFPLVFSLLGARIGYNVREYLRFLVSFPATLLPLLLTSLAFAYSKQLASLLGVSKDVILPVIPKIGLVWFFYMLMTCARHSLRLNPNESFVIAAVGIFAGRVVLDSLGGVSLVLG